MHDIQLLVTIYSLLSFGVKAAVLLALPVCIRTSQSSIIKSSKKSTTMDIEPIFSAEQISVHPDLAKIIKEYTKAVIRKNPEDLLAFSATYFKEKVDSKILAEENKDDAVTSNA